MDFQLHTACVVHSRLHGKSTRAEQHQCLALLCTGWDFSSRWLADGRSLASCRTTAVVPADLNAMLYQVCWELLPFMVRITAGLVGGAGLATAAVGADYSAQRLPCDLEVPNASSPAPAFWCSPHNLRQAECNIASFAQELGEAAVAAAFLQHAAARLAAIDALLWDAGSGQWRDLIMGAAEWQGQGQGQGQTDAAPAVCGTHRHGTVVAASNWLPLYCGCAPAGSPQAAAAVASLRTSGLLQAAGVAVTLNETGQQWDWPNCWPPITAMLIEGCAAAGGTEGQQVDGCGVRCGRSLPHTQAALMSHATHCMESC